VFLIYYYVNNTGSNQVIPNINGMSKRVLMLSCQWITDWF